MPDVRADQLQVRAMTDQEALKLVHDWWLVAVPLMNGSADKGFRPRIEPNKYGWSVWLAGIDATCNLFDGKTLAEAVERAQPYAELALKK